MPTIFLPSIFLPNRLLGKPTHRGGTDRCMAESLDDFRYHLLPVFAAANWVDLAFYSFSRPVLSPMESVGVPMMSSMLRNRLAIGHSSPASK